MIFSDTNNPPRRAIARAFIFALIAAVATITPGGVATTVTAESADAETKHEGSRAERGEPDAPHRSGEKGYTGFHDRTEFLGSLPGNALRMESFERVKPGDQKQYNAEGFVLRRVDGLVMKRHNAASRATDGARSIMVDEASTLEFEFAEPTNAFGFSIVDFSDHGEPADLVLTTDSGHTMRLLHDFRGENGMVYFVGIVHDEPFSRITMTTNTRQDGYYLDELYHGRHTPHRSPDSPDAPTFASASDAE